MSKQHCVDNCVVLWSMTLSLHSILGLFQDIQCASTVFCSMVMLYQCCSCTAVVQRALALNCPVGKYIHFPTLPAHVCRVWVNHSTCLYRGTWCIFVLGHIRCTSVLPKLLCCSRQQHVFGPWQVTQQHYVQRGGCVVSSCDFLAPRLMCLHYSIWFLYCRSAIVLMALETHAVTLPQVLTPCSNHHTQLWGVFLGMYVCTHGLSRFWSVSHSHSIFPHFPWDCVVSRGVAEFSVAVSLLHKASLQTGWVQVHCVYAHK